MSTSDDVVLDVKTFCKNGNYYFAIDDEEPVLLKPELVEHLLALGIRSFMEEDLPQMIKDLDRHD